MIKQGDRAQKNYRRSETLPISPDDGEGKRGQPQNLGVIHPHPADVLPRFQIRYPKGFHGDLPAPPVPGPDPRSGLERIPPPPKKKIP